VAPHARASLDRATRARGTRPCRTLPDLFVAASTQAVLMSVYRTLKLRGLNPTKTMADALKTYVMTGRLPALPGAASMTEGHQHGPLRPGVASTRSA